MRRTETFSPTGSPTGGTTTVTIDLSSGTVEIRATDRSDVVVNLDTEHPDDWEVSQLGDLVSVRSPRRRGFRNRSAKVFVEAPTGSDVNVNAASADVSLSGSLGDVRVRTASGDLKAHTVVSLDACTASGDIDVRQVAGRLSANTASGDIEAAFVGGDFEASTASGDVEIDCCNGNSINVKAVSGDIELGLPAGVRVEPDISTLSGSTKLPKPSTTLPPPSAEPRRTVRVRLRTVSGDIEIQRVER